MRYRIIRHLNKDSTDNSTPHSADESHWERETLREILLSTYKEQRRNRIWRNVWRFIWLFLFIYIIWGIIGSNDDRSSVGNKSSEHTAVISLSGEIGGNNYIDQVEMLLKGLEASYANPKMKGIIIRANSPGGSPVVSNTAFNEIRRLKAQHKDIPLYVVAEDVCASGCYYIAAAADKIYADPSSMVGSIGVIGGGFDFTGLMNKLGIKRRLKIAGNNKGMGDPFTPETPEQAKIWRETLTDTHQEFIKAVKLGRGDRLEVKDNPDLFSGRVYSGKKAKKVGLIDDFGSVYSVARDVIKAPEIVDYTKEDKLYQLIGHRFGAEAKSQIKEMIQQMWW